MVDHAVYVGIGSNIDAERNIASALEHLGRRVTLCAVSTFYRCPALERPNHPPFINGVALIRTALGPVELKSRVLRGIEQDLGRVRTEDAYGPRCIDLDILLYDDAIIHKTGVDIPDGQILERVFLAAPLLELAPDLVLPGCGLPLAEAPCLKEAGALTPLAGFTNALKGKLGL